MRARLVAALIVGLVMQAAPAHAESPGVTERLIELLVQKGVLPRDQADALMRQAQQEAKEVPAARKAAKAKPPATAAATPAAPAEPAPPKGTVRVTYVPEIVRQQIAEQVRHDVMQQAKTEGWAEPNVVPGWVQRIKFSGDMRVRQEFDQFPSRPTFDSQGRYIGGNYPFFPDFQSINNGSGFDTNGTALPPLLNTTENRARTRLRLRLGAEAQIDDWVSAGLRIASGNDQSAVSTNQTLGSPGYFSKYAIWLDRAYVKFTPADWATGWVGRTPNPFWTSDLVYDDDLNFDGVSAQFNYRHNDRLSGFINTGAYAVFNTDFNFSSTSIDKTPSHDKYLFGIQGGGDWKIADDYAAKLGIGYFQYTNIQGKLSSPCQILVSSDSCNTDLTRAQYYAFSNTVFPVRNLVPNPNNPTGGALPQYYGLASNFGVLDLHGRFDINVFDPIGIAIEGDYARNLGYSQSSIQAKGPVNNLGPGNAFKGGPNAYLVRLTVGTPEIAKLWDWNVSLAYKYIESDAVVSALTDSDFHLGGTNAKGYVLGGNLGIARNTYVTARWLSANEVSGPPYAVDVLQFDLNVRF